MVLPVPTAAVSYVAAAVTVTTSPTTTPANVPAVTAAVVVPSATFDSVRVGVPIVNCTGAVAGNTADTTPEPAAFVAVAPATVKKFAVTPVNV